MRTYEVRAIGTVHHGDEGSYLQIDQEYRPGLHALDGFGHLDVVCWFDQADTPELRSILQAPQPYKKAPEIMGIFATRSPIRPNPIALSVVEILSIDDENGILSVAYIDADEGTPILDLKPYTPSIDRVEHPIVPSWSSHWPKSIESSGTFSWEDEFNF